MNVGIDELVEELIKRTEALCTDEPVSAEDFAIGTDPALHCPIKLKAHPLRFPCMSLDGKQVAPHRIKWDVKKTEKKTNGLQISVWYDPDHELASVEAYLSFADQKMVDAARAAVDSLKPGYIPSKFWAAIDADWGFEVGYPTDGLPVHFAKITESIFTQAGPLARASVLGALKGAVAAKSADANTAAAPPAATK